MRLKKAERECESESKRESERLRRLFTEKKQSILGDAIVVFLAVLVALVLCNLAYTFHHRRQSAMKEQREIAERAERETAQNEDRENRERQIQLGIIYKMTYIR